MRPKYLDDRLTEELKKIRAFCEERGDRSFTMRGVFGDSNERLDAQKLGYWKLIEEGKGSWWKLTNKGIDFLEEKIQVLKKVYILHDKVVLDDDGEPVGGDEMVGVGNADERWQTSRLDYSTDYIPVPRKKEVKDIDWKALGYLSVDEIFGK